MEGARSLDINRLNWAGRLRPGYWAGGWQWTRNGEGGRSKLPGIEIIAAAPRLTATRTASYSKGLTSARLTRLHPISALLH